MLENHCDVAPLLPQFFLGQRSQISTTDDDLTARRPLQIIQAPHQSTFPGTGHSDNSVDVSLLNVERDIPQRFHTVSLLLEGL